MADQELKIWASVPVKDAIKNNQQRRLIKEEEWLTGWLRLQGITAQQINQVLNLQTHYSPPADTCPYLHLETAPLTDQMIQTNGQTITAADQPVLFEFYGNTLPDTTSFDPTGWVHVVRNH